MNTTVGQGQNIFDVALEQYGSIEGALLLIKDNQLGGWKVSEGQMLKVQGDVIDKKVKGYYLDNKIKPATAIIKQGNSFSQSFDESFDAVPSDELSGIGVMEIGNTFIVQ